MEIRYSQFIVTGCFLAFASAAHADILSGDTTVSGFGTLGGVYNSNRQYGFVRDIGQETPPGRQSSWKSDSLLGLQVAHTFNPQWQVVGQGVLRKQVEENLDNTITRAFVAYRPTANVHLRLGRMADATFLMSDYSDIGYVYPWVRPPVESYAIIAPRFYDGVDLTFSLPDNTGVWRLKGLAGRIDVAIPQSLGPSYRLAANDLWGLALIREQGPLKVRIGYTSFHLRNPSTLASQVSPALDRFIANPALAAFPAIAAEARALRSEVNSMEGAHGGFASAGFSYDDGTWMVQAEVSDLTAETKIFPVGQQGYVSVGRHFGDFLPYVMLSGSRASALFKGQNRWQALGAAAGTLQDSTLAVLNSQRSAQSTLSLGVRWDFDSRAALKLQWDHVHVRSQGWGLWTAPYPDSGNAGSANLLSATLDFVF